MPSGFMEGESTAWWRTFYRVGPYSLWPGTALAKAWPAGSQWIPGVLWGAAVETVAIANDSNTNLLSQLYKMLPLIKRGKWGTDFPWGPWSRGLWSVTWRGVRMCTGNSVYTCTSTLSQPVKCSQSIGLVALAFRTAFIQEVSENIHKINH